MKHPDSHTIMKRMPYGHSSLFVDGFTHLSEEMVCGYYTFPADAYYYAAHFPGNPLTPGVLMTECMAQIGLIGMALYHTRNDPADGMGLVAMVESNVQFLRMLPPGSRVEVKSEKVYLRFGKLKVKVEMTDDTGTLISRGELSGMIVKKKTNE